MGSRTCSVREIFKIYRMSLPPPKSELGDGTLGAGPLRVILHIDSLVNNHRNGYLTYLQLLTGFLDMLSTCGQALSQGDGSDFDPGGNREATPPGDSP